ncbi:MAG: sulfatase, partial [Planctomycetes bacterium]|nr:sulfatase [Planctomycetota bacterium]
MRLRESLPALGLLVPLLGCGAAPSGPQRPNVLLITVDTLRQDHLGCYGYERPTSPHLDALAKSAVVFEDAQVQAPWTLPSLASLMTGLETTAHGCRSFHDALAPSYETLAERLFAAGYDTAAVASHVFLGRDYGLDQGFVHFDDELVLEMTRSDEVISSPKITQKGLDFLAAQAGARDAGSSRPWMLWLHYFDPHAEYLRHQGISGQFGTQRPVDLYDGEIAFTDRWIGRLLDGLATHGFEQDTIVVFTADHGEEFGDHGRVDHGHTLYRELLDVPLIVRVPGGTPRRVATMVRSIDLANTLLELTELPPLREGHGVSLVPLLEGRLLDVPASLAELERDAALSATAWVESDRKAIDRRHSGEQLGFDRRADPTEQRPLHGDAVLDAPLA